MIIPIILQVDLAFAPEGSLGAGVEKVGSAMKCGESFGFMHRKDVCMKWLDEALDDMKKDGSFKNLCDQSWQGNYHTDIDSKLKDKGLSLNPDGYSSESTQQELSN